MKKYLRFFKIRFSNSLQYRSAAYAGIITQFAWGFMFVLMFRAFYRANPAEVPMELSQLTSYIWLQQAFLALFMLWFVDGDALNSITNGNVAYELCRPMDLYTMWFTKSLASRSGKAVLRCMPILLVAVCLPEGFRLGLPPDLMTFSLFLLSLLLGLLATCALCMFVYIFTFFTMNPMGIRIFFLSLTEFLTGALIPLPFLPDWLGGILEWLPFAAGQNIPLRIYSGHIAGVQALERIGLQAFWLVAMVAVGAALMKKALRRVVVQGG